MAGVNPQGINPQVNRAGLLHFMAEGVKSKVPEANVQVTNEGLQVIFTKEAIISKIFDSNPDLAKLASVTVDSRGIVVLIRV